MAEYSVDRRALPAGSRFEFVRAADEWALRSFTWPTAQAKPRGSILFQSGRGDMIEKYFEVLAHWHEAGWTIGGFDWRGQGGSGRFLSEPRIGHVNSFETWTGDLAAYWSRWVRETPGPHILMGHSMGGHLVLRTVIERSLAPDALILSSPMLGFETGLLPTGWIAAVVRAAAKRWPERRAWRGHEKPSLPGASRMRLLTHDRKRYADEMWWRENCPELVLGPPSLHWLASAQASCDWIDDAGRPESVACPTFVLGTDADALVSPRAIREIAARLPYGQLLMMGREAAHEILREVDTVRDRAIGAIDTFLETI